MRISQRQPECRNQSRSSTSSGDYLLTQVMTQKFSKHKWEEKGPWQEHGRLGGGLVLALGLVPDFRIRVSNSYQSAA